MTGPKYAGLDTLALHAGAQPDPKMPVTAASQRVVGPADYHVDWIPLIAMWADGEGVQAPIQLEHSKAGGFISVIPPGGPEHDRQPLCAGHQVEMGAW